MARNWRGPDGEIDLVARRGRTLVICEVKTRSGGAYGDPFEAVTRSKQLRLRRLAAAFLRTVPGSWDVRFDVASVRSGRLEVIEEAF